MMKDICSTCGQKVSIDEGRTGHLKKEHDIFLSQDHGYKLSHVESIFTPREAVEIFGY
jgi:hypothetical protein